MLRRKPTSKPGGDARQGVVWVEESAGLVKPISVEVGLTDGVHRVVQIRKLRANGLSQHDAARSGLQQVGFACMLTSLTTAIGLATVAASALTCIMRCRRRSPE